MIPSTSPTGMTAKGIWSREAWHRGPREDQIGDGVKVAEREEGTL